MGFKELRERVCRANVRLSEAGLVVLTWGNVSEADHAAGVMAIKPSGVDYADLTPKAMVVLSLANGEVIEGNLRPSSDAPSHIVLYRSLGRVGGIAHTHSPAATAWAQAGREILCLGTTHADLAHGPIPLARCLAPEEILDDYEGNTGKVIAERFLENDLDPLHVPAALVPGHGPFTWGTDAAEAVEHAIALEEVARIARDTVMLNRDVPPLPDGLSEKHFLRKHGPEAYYGQPHQHDK
jgi:L-ribulose-5-phosphate 4-epimerase